MPMRDIVAGEAQLRSWVSNRKLTLGPNWMRSPLGMVNSRLSSRTEFRLSIHSGSMSPSHTIQELTSRKHTKKTHVHLYFRYIQQELSSLSRLHPCCQKSARQTISDLFAPFEWRLLLTLWFSDHIPGTMCEDAISPFSGVHVYMSQQLLSGHGLRIHCVLLYLQKHNIS